MPRKLAWAYLVAAALFGILAANEAVDDDASALIVVLWVVAAAMNVFLFVMTRVRHLVEDDALVLDLVIGRRRYPWPEAEVVRLDGIADPSSTARLRATFVDGRRVDTSEPDQLDGTGRRDLAERLRELADRHGFVLEVDGD